ncbi:MAG: sodium:solute symporter family protein [Synergistaceae bacterium]|jgi:Na+/proline symporter|nr:sodium:solute symporter family protein [Synergistaceae bacterium]
MLIASWGVTFLVIIGLGVWAGKAISKSNQWSGGDKTLGLVAVGCVFGAWQIGGISIVGAAQNGYNFGIAAMWYSVGSSFYFFVCALLAKAIRENMPGDSAAVFLEKRFNKNLSRLYSIVWLIMVFFYIPVQMKTVSSIIQIVLPDVNMLACYFLALCIATFYTSFSGMKGSAVVGKIVSFGIYFLLCVFVWVSLDKFGGYGQLVANLPEGYGNIFAGSMTPSYVLSMVIGGILSSSVMQSVLQPILAAKDYKAARYGSFIGYIFSAPICIITGIMGMMAAKQSNFSLGNGATAYAWIVREMSGPLLAGVIFAVSTMIIAATMATMMMAAGTVLKSVWGDMINPRATDSQLLSVSRWGTLIFSFSCLIPAIMLPSASLTTMFLTLLYSATCPFSFAIIFGLLWKKVTAAAALWSSVLGVLTAVIWVVTDLNSTVCSVVYPTIAIAYLVGVGLTMTANTATGANS